MEKIKLSKNKVRILQKTAQVAGTTKLSLKRHLESLSKDDQDMVCAIMYLGRDANTDYEDTLSIIKNDNNQNSVDTMLDKAPDAVKTYLLDALNNCIEITD